MAKGQHQGTREKRKPKQDKPKGLTASVAPFSSAVAKYKASKGAKGR